VRCALAYAVESAAGTYVEMRDNGHAQKGYVLGALPSHNGVVSALMAANGFSCVVDTFSGDTNVFTMFGNDPEPDQLTRALGSEFEIMNTGIKRWPVGLPIQAALQTLQEMIKTHGFTGAEVEKLVARLPQKQLPAVSNRDNPDNCVEHLLALWLHDGGISFHAAHDYRRLKDRKVLAMRARVETVGDPELNDPLMRSRCAMEVTLRNGAVLTHQVLTAKGSFEDPMTRTEEQEKALDLIAPVLGKRRAQEFLDTLWNLERVRDMRSLRKLTTA
jgi:2-methylcitrate dehydratase PrpD